MNPNHASDSLAPIHHALNEVLGVMQQVLETLKRPTPKWETIPHAMKTRHVGRKAIMDLMTTGKIRVQQVPAPGGYAYNVSVDDLDRIFPVRSKK